MMPASAVLGIVDMQHAFGPGTEWETPGFDELRAGLPDLISRFSGRIALTRYLPPSPVEGSWGPYFKRYPAMLRDDRDPLWDLALDVPAGAVIVDVRRFNKWGPALSRIVGPETILYLAGVATECCVMATAIAAADAGRFVRVIAEACRGSSSALHEQALQVMASFAPQIEVVSADQACAGAEPSHRSKR
jgi:nicotinamidase-related amidase